MAYKIMGTTPSPFYTNMMIYYIMCDTPADLPSTISDIGYGTTIGYGSRADIISDSSKYLWNGSQWVRQTTGGGGGASSADQVSYDNTDSGMTATNVQDAIDEIKDLDDMQDRALAELYGENANQQLEINYAINTGAKNLLKITASSQTIKGVTFTVNDDQTVTVNGTNDGTGASTFVIVPHEQAITIPDGNYILSGCPAGGGDTVPYDLRWYMYSPGKSAYESGTGASVEKSGNGTGSNIAIVVKTGQTANNLVFKPMIRPAEITNNTFEPYAPTNRELYETCETKVTIQQAYGDATAIPANSDLNNYTTPGIYYAVIANIPSMANTPYTSTGLRLVVEKNTLSGVAVFQTLYPTSRTHLEFYKRVYEGGSWSSWYKFEGTRVASASTQSLNSPLLLNREEIAPLETTEIRETEETEETNETEETE